MTEKDTTFVALLKDCILKKDLHKGIKVHADVLKKGLLGKSPYIASALITMYAKCGSLPKATQVFETLPVQNVVSWNALIAGYGQQKHFYEIFNCFGRMQRDGISPNAITFICVLKACIGIRSIEKGKQIHNEIVSRGLLDNHILVGTTLVDMYAKCGELHKAQKLLEELHVRNVVSWNALIAGYTQHGKGIEAFTCFEQMQSEGYCPDVVTFICILNACGKIRSVEKGKRIHKEIMVRGLLEKHVSLGNALVDMYAKSGDLAKAQNVLEQLPVRNVVSWSTLISGYAQAGLGHEALSCFDNMQSDGLCANVVTFISILKACGNEGNVDKGKQIHDEILNRGFLEKDISLGVALVDMYTKCGLLTNAEDLFEELHVRDVVSWSALIAGYVQQGYSHEALHCFERMQTEGLSPNAVTFTCILKACGSIGAIDKGKHIHEEIVNKGLLEKEIVLANALADMYSKCGLLSQAQGVLELLPSRNVVSWNVLISGYAEQGQCREAWSCVKQMQTESLSPNTATFVCILKACTIAGAIDKGKHIHNQIVIKGLIGKDIVLFNALLDMYAKCGRLVEAEKLFEDLPIQNIVAWSALMSGYAQWGQGQHALNYYERMQSKGLAPNMVTFISILQACGSIGAIDKGKCIHDEIESKGLLDKDVMLGNALVDMYTKCGALVEARQTLEEIPDRNIISWNGLIAGYAQQRQVHQALNCFQQIQSEGLSPDEVTFVCVLNACSHSGLLDKAQTLFGNMAIKHGVFPHLEHLTCMVVIFGCAGYFDKAISVIKAEATCDYLAIWLALLSSCRKWGHVTLGKVAFDQILQRDANSATAYVLMAATFASAGMHEDAKNLDSMRLKLKCAAWK